MTDVNEQVKLYRERNRIRRFYNPIKIEKSQWFYIKDFVGQNKKKIRWIFTLLFLITLIEIFIVIFSNFFLKRFSFLLDLSDFYKGFVFLALILLFYLVCYFFNLKFQKQVIIEFVNKLRRDWITTYFKKPASTLKHRDRGNLLVKISYHFSLLQTGLNNSVFDVVHWVFLTVGTISAAFFINFKLLVISLVMFVVNIIVFYIGYIVSIYYVGQDQTLYSKILQYVSNVFGEFSFYKQHNKEKEFFKNLDKLVQIDTFFRVRRELFLKLGDIIIFTSLVVVSVLAYISDIYFPFFEIDGRFQSVVYLLVLILIVRLLHLSLRIGLYFFPLKLGLFISVPVNFHKSRNNWQQITKIKKITFQSQKAKLGLDNNYLKNVEFVFESGKRYLITGKEGSGKSLLASIISGTSSVFAGRPWVIKVNNDIRLMYKYWSQFKKGIYYINPYSYTESAVFDTLSGEYDLFESDKVKSIQHELIKYKNIKSFDFIFAADKYIGKSFSSTTFSFTEMAIVQILHCLIEKPDVIVIDNLWIDLNNSRINEAIKLLDQNLPDSIIIIFSTTESTLIEYDKAYNI